MPKILKFLVTLLILLFLYAGFRTLFYSLSVGKINIIEKYMMNTGLEVITAGYQQRIKSVELLAKDWSYWDAPYNFMGGQNDAFPGNELTDETLENQGLNMILFYNTGGNLAYKKTFSLNTGKAIEIPTQLLNEDGPQSLKTVIAKVAEDKEGKSGLIHTLNGNLIYAIYPVLHSNGEGPARGALLMGKYLDAHDIELIRAGVGLELNIRDAYNMPNELKAHFSKNQTFFERHEDSLVAYKLIRDIFDTPAFYLEFYYPKIVFNYWNTLINIFALISSLTCMVPVIFFFMCRKKICQLPQKT